MDRERFQKMDELLDGALDRPPEERSRWLGEPCAGDDDLLREVERLLALAEVEDDRLKPDGAFSGIIFEEVARELERGSGVRQVQAGDQLGPYRVVEFLGKGIQGIVVLVLVAAVFGGGDAWGYREGFGLMSEFLGAEVRGNLFDRVETLARLRTGDESGAIELLEGAVDRAVEAVSQGHAFSELSPDAQFALQTARAYWGAYPLNGRSEELSAVLATVPLPDVEYCSPALRKLMEEARSRGVEPH